MKEAEEIQSFYKGGIIGKLILNGDFLDIYKALARSIRKSSCKINQWDFSSPNELCCRHDVA
ncbi:CLUMA_CG006729, isoform A [Clunio marinus]|uniref:CLUMA_CG006729, isoform A n=1 Tax=Clunio marinus TaxID=568069 RepID=A0A1J1I479_9DIPT|nr:CLUMA_CG006729, isoform A [Clunio marinus]